MPAWAVSAAAVGSNWQRTDSAPVPHAAEPVSRAGGRIMRLFEDPQKCPSARLLRGAFINIHQGGAMPDRQTIRASGGTVCSDEQEAQACVVHPRNDTPGDRPLQRRQRTQALPPTVPARTTATTGGFDQRPTRKAGPGRPRGTLGTGRVPSPGVRAYRTIGTAPARRGAPRTDRPTHGRRVTRSRGPAGAGPPCLIPVELRAARSRTSTSAPRAIAVGTSGAYRPSAVVESIHAQRR